LLDTAKQYKIAPAKKLNRRSGKQCRQILKFDLLKRFLIDQEESQVSEDGFWLIVGKVSLLMDFDWLDVNLVCNIVVR